MGKPTSGIVSWWRQRDKRVVYGSGIGAGVLLVLVIVFVVTQCGGGGSAAPTTARATPTTTALGAPSPSATATPSTLAPTTTTTVAQPPWAPAPFQSSPRSGLFGSGTFRVSLTIVLACIAALIAVPAAGSWWRVGLVTIGGAMLWLLLVPDIRPTVRTPSGLYRFSLGSDDAIAPGRTVAAINTKCEAQGGAAGELVNLGNDTYNVLLLVTIDDRTTYAPVLGLKPGTVQAWAAGATRDAATTTAAAEPTTTTTNIAPPTTASAATTKSTSTTAATTVSTIATPTTSTCVAQFVEVRPVQVAP